MSGQRFTRNRALNSATSNPPPNNSYYRITLTPGFNQRHPLWQFFVQFVYAFYGLFAFLTRRFQQLHEPIADLAKQLNSVEGRLQAPQPLPTTRLDALAQQLQTLDDSFRQFRSEVRLKLTNP